MADQQRRLPAWLLGLMIAIIVFFAVLFLAIALGYGDDPAIGAPGIVVR
ncbi:MAG: hypothetical protein PVG83_07635 [Acidimicrobiia bacterium]|jgi:hypothetical protein